MKYKYLTGTFIAALALKLMTTPVPGYTENQLSTTNNVDLEELLSDSNTVTENTTKERSATIMSHAKVQETESQLSARTVDSVQKTAETNEPSYLDKNWRYEETPNQIVLTKYIGQSKEIALEGKINGKQVVLKALNEQVIPRDITRLVINDSDDERVLLEDTSLSQAFKDFQQLETVDLRGLDTANVTDFSSMFENCEKLKQVDLAKWHTEKVTTMRQMFKNCENLTEVDLENFNTSVVDDMQEMFYGCEQLQVIDLSSFTTKEDTEIDQMFTTENPSELLVLTEDAKILALDLEKQANRTPLSGITFKANGGSFSNNQQQIEYFDQCVDRPNKIALETFADYKSKLIPTRTGFATEFTGWKENRTQKTDVENVLDLLGTTYTAEWQDSDWMFTETETEILLTGYKGSATEIEIPGEINGKQVILEDINPTVIPQTITKFVAVEKNDKKVKIKDTDLKQAFYRNQVLTKVDLRGLDVSQVTDFSEFFKECNQLKKVNLSGLNMSKAQSFNSMFYGCVQLSDVDLANVNSQSVTDMARMFYNCNELEQMDLTNFDTTAVQTMEEMFYNCFVKQELKSLDLSSFNTPSLVNTDRMFQGAKLPKILDLTQFDMDHVTNVIDMFDGDPQELLIVTNDDSLLKYPYEQDQKTPLQAVTFDAKGGIFENQKPLKFYFTTCAVTPEKLTERTFEQFKNQLVPIKINAIFRGWHTPENKQKDANADLLTQTYTAIWKNMTCNTSVDNKKLDTSGEIGLAYLPEKFSLPYRDLFDGGEQTVPFTKTESLNVGIRDISQSQSSWYLTSQLKWSADEIDDAYLQFEGNSENIKKNKNDNMTEYNAKTDLVDADDEVRISSAEDGKIKVTAEMPTKILEANQEKTHDDIYDYDLGEAMLVIPETERVKDGKYQANVVWNLTNAPQ